MTNRDWDNELKKIDKAIERAPAEAARPTPSDPGSATAGIGAASRPTTSFGVFTRLGLAVALGIGIVFWPYGARCGAGLAAYLASVAVLIGAGIWSSVWTWRHRAAKGHSLALLIALWGVILGAIEVLPRIGYAIPTALHPGTWFCS